MKKLLIFIFFVVLLVFYKCRYQHPPEDEYQIVGFIANDSMLYGRPLILSNQLILLYNNDKGNVCFNRIQKFTLDNPAQPTLNEEVRLSEIVEMWSECFAFNDRYVFSKFYYDTLFVADIVNGNVFKINFGIYFYSIAVKDTFMYMLSDSGLLVWNINDIQNPYRVFEDTVNMYIYQGIVALADTICIECLYFSTFKVWNIIIPSAPELVASGSLGIEIPDKVVILSNDIFTLGQTSLIYRFILTDSGTVLPVQHLSVYPIFDFIVDSTNIYLLSNRYFLVGSAYDFSYWQLWESTPLFDNQYDNEFEVYKGYVYITVPHKGTYIFHKMEEE